MSGSSKNLNKALLAGVLGPGLGLTVLGAEQVTGVDTVDTATGLLRPQTPTIPTPTAPPPVPPPPEPAPSPPTATEIGEGVAKQKRRRRQGRFGIADTLLVRPGLGAAPAALGGTS